MCEATARMTSRSKARRRTSRAHGSRVLVADGKSTVIKIPREITVQLSHQN